MQPHPQNRHKRNKAAAASAASAAACYRNSLCSKPLLLASLSRSKTIKLQLPLASLCRTLAVLAAVSSAAAVKIAWHASLAAEQRHEYGQPLLTQASQRCSSHHPVVCASASVDQDAARQELPAPTHNVALCSQMGLKRRPLRPLACANHDARCWPQYLSIGRSDLPAALGLHRMW